MIFVRFMKSMTLNGVPMPRYMIKRGQRAHNEHLRPVRQGSRLTIAHGATSWRTPGNALNSQESEKRKMGIISYHTAWQGDAAREL